MSNQPKYWNQLSTIGLCQRKLLIFQPKLSRFHATKIELRTLKISWSKHDFAQREKHTLFINWIIKNGNEQQESYGARTK